MLPSLEQLNDDRQGGHRPEVVGCFINEGHVLMLYKKDYRLWQFPQGGIENKETLEAAFTREMLEELGAEFIGSIGKDLSCFWEDSMDFPPVSQESRELVTDRGEKVAMLGKKYYFVWVNAPQTTISLSETEFDDLAWLGFKEALGVSRLIYQTGKRRVTLAAVEKLHELGAI